MRFSPLLDFEDWLEIGQRVGMHANASQWWLGDWLAYGRYKYGRRYKLGLAVSGLDYQTLRNYAAVARRFEISRRRDKLSFQHHAEVCALSDEEQEGWLGRAEAERWSRNELRRQLRCELRPGGSLESVSMRLTVDLEREARWRKAAKLSESELEAWMVAALDHAAESALEWT